MRYSFVNLPRILTVTAALAPGLAHAAPTILQVVEHAQTDTVTVHAGNKHDNVGDILTFTNPVFDMKNEKQLGTDQGYCVRTIVGSTYECHWMMMLQNGQIAVDGPFYDNKDSDMAIIGGTGAYQMARGQMKLHARDAKGSEFDFVYELKMK